MKSKKDGLILHET